MKLEAVMAYFKPNHKLIAKSNYKTFHYSSIEVIDDFSDYPELTLGVENDDRVFIGKCHFRKKDGNPNKIYSIAFRTIFEEGETKKKYSISYYPKKDSEPTQFHYDEKENLYFELPKIEKDKSRKWKFKNGILSSAVGTINPGVFYIAIDDQNSKTYTVNILPSSISPYKYKKMLKDIMNIKRELIISSEGGKQSILVEWQNTLDQLMEKIDEIEQAIKKISPNPKGKFIETYREIPKQKVKKFNAKTIMEYYTNPGKNTISSITKKNCTDIYEHRIIKNSLINLANYIEDLTTQLKSEIDEEKRELEKIIGPIRNVTCEDAKIMEAIHNLNVEIENSKHVRFDFSTVESEKETNIEIIEEIESLIDKVKALNKKYEQSKQNIENQSKLKNRINALLEVDFLKNAAERKENWKVTQIFNSDKNYRKIYKSLRGIDKKYELSDDYNQKGLLIRKTDELYEVWLLIQMCKILLNSGWKLSGNFPLKDYINEWFKRNKDIWIRDKKQSTLEGIEIPFEFHVDSSNVHEYVQFTKIEMKVIYNADIGGKTPDYLFEITLYPNNNEKPVKKSFYLDAKYRNYDEQDGLWHDDINDVAIKKYINHFVEKGIQTDGAYIVHSSEEKEYTYFGGHARNYIASIKKKMEDDRIIEDTNRNPDHRFGSFSCTPDHIQHLKTFFKMLLEYKFIEYGTPFVCFECGNASPKVVDKGSKYHITCSACGEFWVQNHCGKNGHLLVKHALENYHTEIYPDYKWLVKCPKCDFK